MLVIEYINDKNYCLLHCNVRLSYLVYTIKKVVLRPILDISDAMEWLRQNPSHWMNSKSPSSWPTSLLSIT